MFEIILRATQAMYTLTYNSPTFYPLVRGPRRFEGQTYSVQSPTKKGTVMVPDTSNAGKAKVADVTITCAGDADWVRPLILIQNIRDYDTGAVEGWRDQVNSDANLNDVIAAAFQPGMEFKIGQQNSTDKQAGWVGSITRGDRLYGSCNTISGAADGGIWNLATFTNSANATCYALPVGWAKNSVSASTDVLEAVYDPGFQHASL